MTTNKEALEQWNDLEDKWEAANQAAAKAQQALDYKLRTHLIDDSAPAPTLEEQESVDKLWLCEAERRGAMDEFLAEHFYNE